MEAIVPAVASAFSGGSALATLGTAASIGGSVLGTISQVQSLNYQAAVLAQTNEDLRAERDSIMDRSQAVEMEADFEALAAIGGEQARQSASGFAMGSGSFVRRNRRNVNVARQNTLRIREGAELELEGIDRQIDVNADQGDVLRAGRRAALFEGIVGVGSSLVSGADLVSRNRIRRTNREAMGVQ